MFVGEIGGRTFTDTQCKLIRREIIMNNAVDIKLLKISGILLLQSMEGENVEAFKAGVEKFDEVRGLHLPRERDLKDVVFTGLEYYPIPHAHMTRLWMCEGVAHCVLVDIRLGSSTYGQSLTCLLDSKIGTSVFIPKGFAVGIAPISSPCLLGEKSNLPYRADAVSYLDYKRSRIDLGFAFSKKMLVYDRNPPKKMLLSDILPYDERIERRPLTKGEVIVSDFTAPSISQDWKVNARDAEFVYDESCARPVLHIRSYPLLVQAIGKLKYLLKEERNGGLHVVYRGQTRGYSDPLTPSLFRACGKTDKKKRLDSLARTKRILAECDPKGLAQLSDEALEGLLQQYGLRTSWIDAVDNVWIALWFACYRVAVSCQGAGIHYVRRTPCREKSDSQFAYIYVLGYPAEHYGWQPDDETKKKKVGLHVEDTCQCLDLRMAVPSQYVRPHAQHGLLLRMVKSGSPVRSLEQMVQVVLRIDLQDALDWLGIGVAVSTEGLFPSPDYDIGYQKLLRLEEVVKQKHPELYKDVNLKRNSTAILFDAIRFQRIFA